MTSLSEVYGEHSEGPGLRRLYLGTGLFLAGALLSLCAIVVGSTSVLAGLGVDLYGARKIAGTLAGIGVPAVMLGVFTVLPTGRRIKVAAVIGAGVCVLGVSLFWHAYPTYWTGSPAAKDLTLQVVGVYFVGITADLWCLFTAVVNFKTRNDPGGTARLNVEKKGQTRVVTVPRKSGGVGSVGMFGSDPEGDVETQTNRGEDRSSATADGGATTQDISSPMDDVDEKHDAELLGDEPSPDHADSYCGNCEHFDYVRTESGMQPYCGHHDEVMDDMEACEEWTPNNDGGRL